MLCATYGARFLAASSVESIGFEKSLEKGSEITYRKFYHSYSYWVQALGACPRID